MIPVGKGALVGSGVGHASNHGVHGGDDRDSEKKSRDNPGDEEVPVGWKWRRRIGWVLRQG